MKVVDPYSSSVEKDTHTIITQFSNRDKGEADGIKLVADIGWLGKLRKRKYISSSSFDCFVVGNMEDGTICDWFVLVSDITCG